MDYQADKVIRKAAIDWSAVGKDDYLSAMQCDVVKDTEIKALLGSALTDQINDRPYL